MVKIAIQQTKFIVLFLCFFSKYLTALTWGSLKTFGQWVKLNDYFQYITTLGDNLYGIVDGEVYQKSLQDLKLPLGFSSLQYLQPTVTGSWMEDENNAANGVIKNGVIKLVWYHRRAANEAYEVYRVDPSGGLQKLTTLYNDSSITSAKRVVHTPALEREATQLIWEDTVNLTDPIWQMTTGNSGPRYYIVALDSQGQEISSNQIICPIPELNEFESGIACEDYIEPVNGFRIDYVGGSTHQIGLTWEIEAREAANATFAVYRLDYYDNDESNREFYLASSGHNAIPIFDGILNTVATLPDKIIYYMTAWESDHRLPELHGGSRPSEMRACLLFYSDYATPYYSCDPAPINPDSLGQVA